MHVHGPKALQEDVLRKNLCINCGACTGLCPYLKTYRGKTALLFSCTREQGRCYAHCPKAEVDLDELSTFLFGRPYDGSPLGRHLRVLTSRAGDKAPWGPFQCGGTVSALMTFALKSKRIDAAVLTGQEDGFCKPRLVTRPKDVVRFASSKYMAAPTVGMLNQGLRDGYRRPGIVGTPCQMTAVAKLRAHAAATAGGEDPVALTVGLFCTWALAGRDLHAFLSRKLNLAGIRKMDIPPPPADILVVETETEVLQLPLAEVRPLIPPGCSICPDMTAELSDVSVGVLEGSSDRNTLVIRSERGEALVAAAVKAGYLVTGEMPRENLEHLCAAAAAKKRRAFLKASDERLLNTSEEGRRSALRARQALPDSVQATSPA